MKRDFIFCHGFGFDKSFWRNLAPYFAKESCFYLDLGYFGDEISLNRATSRDFLIGIGHSLGLPKLLSLNKKLNKKFDVLIGLNGFVNFLGNHQKLRQKRERELQILKEYFERSPGDTLERFYQRCGIPSETHMIERIQKGVALNDLWSLSNIFYVPDEICTLIIGAKDDVVVPVDILHDNFDQYRNVTIQIMDFGGHGLGFLEASKVYQRIIKFLNGSQ